MTLEDENARLQAENAALREQMTALVERVQDLEARLAKTATTATSRPPRTDSSANYPGPRSLRRKSGKKPGGQVGCMRYMQAKAWRSRWG